MKKMNFLLSLLAIAMLTSSCAQKSENAPINVMTYNLRYDNQGDTPNHWDARKEVAAATIKEKNVQLLGVQEALISQINFLDSTLSDYVRVGVGRDNGADAGEFSAIYYDSKRFIGKDERTLWLSETPNQVSLGWDGACRRILTYAILEDRLTGKELVFFNTHYDHVGKEARANSSKLIINTIKEVAGERPAIFCGDLNATIEDEPIQYLLNQDLLFNTRDIAAKVTGNNNTYHGFGTTEAGIIDYIMVTKGVKVNSNEILPDKVNDVYLSDHNPILTEILIEK